MDNIGYSNDAVFELTIANGVVYAGTRTVSPFKLLAINSSTGLFIWNATINGSSELISSTPEFSNGLVYVGSGTNKTLYAFNSSNGGVVWSFNTSGTVRAYPTIVGNVVYFGSRDNQMYALNASTGILIWNYSASGVFSRIKPLVINDTLYSLSGDGIFYALNSSTGTHIWNFSTGSFSNSATGIHRYPSANISNGIVYISGESNLTYALNATTGATSGITQ